MKTEKAFDEKMWEYYQKEYADKLALSYPRQKMIFEKMSKFIKSGGKVLEIGFGEGSLLCILSERFETYGADISEENIRRVKNKTLKIKFKLINIDGKIPYQNEYFDGFIATEVLEHMSDKELLVCADEIYRILKSGGYAIITVPAEEDLKMSECFCPNCGEIFHKYGHKQVWDKNNIKKRFNKFKVISIKEYFNPFVGKTIFENLMGKIMQSIQIFINLFFSFPNKIYRNRSYVIVLKK